MLVSSTQTAGASTTDPEHKLLQHGAPSSDVPTGQRDTVSTASEQDGLREQVCEKFRICATYHSLLQFSAEAENDVLRGQERGDNGQQEEGQREDALGHEGEEVNEIT